MGFGQSKQPPQMEITHYLHQEKIDGSLATQKEEERRKKIEELRAQRKREIQEKQKEIDAKDPKLNFFVDAVMQGEVERKKKKKKGRKKKKGKSRKKSRSRKDRKKSKSRKKSRDKKKGSKSKSKKKSASRNKSKKDKDKDSKKSSRKGKKKEKSKDAKKDEKDNKSKNEKKFKTVIDKDKPKKKIKIKGPDGKVIEQMITISDSEDSKDIDSHALADRYLDEDELQLIEDEKKRDQDIHIDKFKGNWTKDQEECKLILKFSFQNVSTK